MSCISNKLFRIEVTNAKQLFHGTTNYENKAKQKPTCNVNKNSC